MTYETSRKVLGFSQAQLAAVARTSQSAISRLERGLSCPSAEARVRETLGRLGAPVPGPSVADRIADLTVERLRVTPAQRRALDFAEERRASR